MSRRIITFTRKNPNFNLSQKSLAFIFLLILKIVGENKSYAVEKYPLWSEHVQTFNGTTFSLVYDPVLSWTQAVSACAEKGLKLAKIETREELSFLVDVMMKPAGLVNAWLGATRLNNSQNLFTWISDGSPVSSDLWTKGQPDNKGGNETCVHIWNYDDKLNDGQERHKLPFVCSETRSPCSLFINS